MQENVTWGGCATLDPDDPKLWVVRQADGTRTDPEAQGFSLAEVIDAGLRQKVVGLSESDRNAAIAECIADTLSHLRSDRDQIDRLLGQLNDVAWQVACGDAKTANKV